MDQIAQLSGHHCAHLLDDGSVVSGLLHDVQAVADRGQRIAQFVSERGEEVVLPSVGCTKRLLVLLLPGPVAKYLEEADVLAVVEYCSRCAVCVEAAAVLANQPSVVVGSPLLHGCAQFAVCSLMLFSRKQNMRWLTDPLLFEPAQDHLDALIPRSGA